MKLHLPKQLFTALLACFSAGTVAAAEITGTFTKADTNTTTAPTLTLSDNAGALTATFETKFTNYTDSTNPSASYKTGSYYKPDINVHKTGSWELTLTLDYQDADVIELTVDTIDLNLFTYNGSNGNQDQTRYVDVTLADNEAKTLASETDKGLDHSGAYTTVTLGAEAESIATLAGGEEASSDSFTIKVSKPTTEENAVGTFVGLKDITLNTSATIRSGADVTWANGTDAGWSGESWKTKAGTIGTMADTTVGDATFEGVVNADSTLNDYTVTVNAAAVAASITVSSGNYAFAAGSYTADEVETAGTLHITNGLTINEGASAIFNVATTLAGTVSNAGSLTFTGSLTIAENSTATLNDTVNIHKTITNNGTLNLNGTLNVVNLSGLTEGEGSYSTGDNGFYSGAYIVIDRNASPGDGTFQMQLAGATLSTDATGGTYYTRNDETGQLSIFVNDSTQYWIRTNLSYADISEEDRSKATSYEVVGGTEFYLTDATVLSKTNLLADSSMVYYRPDETNLLRFTGAAGGAGLDLSASGTTVSMNTATAYAGIIRVLGGTTFNINGQQYDGQIVLEGGATLSNAGAEIATNVHALPTLELAGEATVSLTNRLVMNSTGEAGLLNLNGHKLTKTGAGQFFLNNVAIGSGTLQIDQGTVQTGTGVSLAEGAVLDIIVNSGAILHTNSSYSLNSLTLNNANEICVAAGTLSVTGETNVTGHFKKTGSSTLKLQGATSLEGSVQLTSNSTLEISGALTAGDISKSGNGTLHLKSGIGQQKVLNLTVTEGTLRTEQVDTLAYASTTTMSVQNATLDLDARQTVDGSNSFSLNNGTISGDGGTNSMMNGVAIGLEIHNGETLQITSAGNSIISTNIGFRIAEGKVEYTVTGGTLTNSGIIASHSNGTTGAVVKKGAGELILSGNNTYANGTTVEAGKLTVSHAAALGTGPVSVSEGATLKLNVTGVDSLLSSATGTGSIELNADATLANGVTMQFEGDLQVNSGVLTIGAASGADAHSYQVDIAGLNSVILNGGSVKWGAEGSLVKKLTVKENASSDWSIYDTKSGSTLEITTVDVGAGATLSVNKEEAGNESYKHFLKIGELTGSGAVLINGPGNSGWGETEQSNLLINSLSEFSGSLSMTSREAGKDVYNAVINTGAAGATLKNLEFAGFGQANETSRATFNVQGDTSVANLNVTDSAGFVISEGKKLSIAEGSVNNGTMSAGNASITSAAAETPATMSNVAIQNNSISTTATDGTRGSISNANVEIARLAEDASFTIQDMTLTNTTLTAATIETKVNLQNVAATDLALAQGKFTLNAAPMVGMGGTTANFGTNTDSSFMISKLTADSASLTLNLDVMSAYESTGAVDNVTLTITLAGITGDVSSYSVDAWKALVGFEKSSWLGQALTGAQYSVSDVATAAAEGGVPSVNYGYAATGGEGSNVGTLTITITGLNVPEPASATLGLAALMMLCARRRRKA